MFTLGLEGVASKEENLYSLWRAAFGGEPEEKKTRRPNIIEWQGGDQKWSQAMGCFSNRFDFVEEALVPLGSYFGEFDYNRLASAEDRFLDFARRSQEVAKVFPTPVRRFALGGMCWLDRGSREACYTHLNDMLDRVQIDPATMDFMYRLNQPIEVDGIVVNRMGTWSVVGHRNFEMNPHQESKPLDKEYSIQLQFDISSSSERTGPLDSGAVDKLLTTFAQAASMMLRGERLN